MNNNTAAGKAFKNSFLKNYKLSRILRLFQKKDILVRKGDESVANRNAIVRSNESLDMLHHSLNLLLYCAK